MKYLVFISIPFLIACNSGGNDNTTSATTEKDTATSKTTDSLPPGYGEEDTLSIKDFTFGGYHLYDSISSEAYYKLSQRADSISYDSGVKYDLQGIVQRVLHLKKSSINVATGKKYISDFTLNDSAFDFMIKDTKIKIGSSEGIIKHLFPKSYADKYVMSEDTKDSAIKVGLVKDTSDDHLIFSVSHNKIIGISIFWENETD